MTDPIEAMARAVERELGKQEMVLTDPLTLRRMLAERVTRAALQALRDTLVPAGWMYDRPGSPLPPSITSIRHARGDFYLMQRNGWTETPLYALPEIKP